MSQNAIIFYVVFSVVNLLFVVYCLLPALNLPIPLLIPDYSVPAVLLIKLHMDPNQSSSQMHVNQKYQK